MSDDDEDDDDLINSSKLFWRHFLEKNAYGLHVQVNSGSMSPWSVE
jgi:hypothetical protein